ncbi:hypothetical protein ABE208_07665 [Bacillus inaquosorum]|nr:hypothetical protein [Bacillus inaquosorum]MCY9014690.1 hypothetical protein [Bacillus inaquosorum]MCY9083457.1 hypothetical protein [Bacillus inaquosorum]
MKQNIKLQYVAKTRQKSLFYSEKIRFHRERVGLKKEIREKISYLSYF